MNSKSSVTPPCPAVVSEVVGVLNEAVATVGDPASLTEALELNGRIKRELPCWPNRTIAAVAAVKVFSRERDAWRQTGLSASEAETNSDSPSALRTRPAEPIPGRDQRRRFTERRVPARVPLTHRSRWQDKR